MREFRDVKRDKVEIRAVFPLRAEFLTKWRVSREPAVGFSIKITDNFVNFSAIASCFVSLLSSCQLFVKYDEFAIRIVSIHEKISHCEA